jgi:hypothetical protein
MTDVLTAGSLDASVVEGVCWDEVLVPFGWVGELENLLGRRQKKTHVLTLSLSPSVCVCVCVFPPALWWVRYAAKGEVDYSMYGLVLTLLGCICAAAKGVVTNLLMVGSLKLHPMDLLTYTSTCP